jgi:hypothetical protein
MYAILKSHMPFDTVGTQSLFPLLRMSCYIKSGDNKCVILKSHLPIRPSTETIGAPAAKDVPLNKKR